MSNMLSAKGIILGRMNYSEADKIITFISKEYGKTRFIAKGIRKQKSKMAGGLELFCVSEVHFIKGRGDIDTLTSARLVRHYSNIVKDLSRTELAYEMLKRIDRILEDNDGGEYYNILDDSLAATNNLDIKVNLVKISFDMRIIQTYGSLPDFTVDKVGNRIDPEKKFVFDRETMSFEENLNGEYSKNHIKLLKLLAHNPVNVLLSIKELDDYLKQLIPIADALNSELV